MDGPGGGMAQPGPNPVYGYPVYVPYPVPVWGPPPVPNPKGRPSRTLFVVGSIGHILVAGFAIPFFVIGSGLGFSFLFYMLGTPSYVALGSSLAMLAGVLVHLFAFFGFWKNYGSQLGLATFILGVVTLASFPLGVFLARVFSSLFALGSILLLGVLFIVEGSAFIVVRNFIGNPGAAIASGVLFIISGSLVCTILLAFLGGILLIPAALIGGVTLLKAPLPRVPGMPMPMYPYPMSMPGPPPGPPPGAP